MKKNTSEFKIFGIFGHPLAHTLSPRMQEAAFAHVGIKAFYLPFELEPRFFKAALQGLSPEMISGFNVTVPFKEKAAELVKQLSPDAKFLKAVNTVFLKSGKWCGTNTDVYGFTQLLREALFKPRGKQALVLGSGGSARAVVYGLCQQGISGICLVNRTPAKAKNLAAIFKKRFPKVCFEIGALENFNWKEKIGKADLIVNTTSVGLKYSDVSLIPPDVLPPAGKAKKLFLDLIYKPAETDFLSKAKSKGHRTMNGLSMLLHQGAKSFECWTQHKAPVAVMREALLKPLQEN